MGGVARIVGQRSGTLLKNGPLDLREVAPRPENPIRNIKPARNLGAFAQREASAHSGHHSRLGVPHCVPKIVVTVDQSLEVPLPRVWGLPQRPRWPAVSAAGLKPFTAAIAALTTTVASVEQP